MRLDRGKLLPRLYVLPRKCLVTFTSQPEPQLKCGDEDHPTRLEAASLLIPFPSLFILTFPIPSAYRLLLPPVATTARFPSSTSARLNSALDMSQTQEKAQEKLIESTSSVPQSTAAQQSDNVAHALAGAGGGLLSMALTYAPSRRCDAGC